jgi:hypothetical protein
MLSTTMNYQKIDQMAEDHNKLETAIERGIVKVVIVVTIIVKVVTVIDKPKDSVLI